MSAGRLSAAARRGAFALAVFFGASIPVVDQLDLLSDWWLLDWIDGLWTVFASGVLVWIVRRLSRTEG